MGAHLRLVYCSGKSQPNISEQKPALSGSPRHYFDVRLEQELRRAHRDLRLKAAVYNASLIALWAAYVSIWLGVVVIAWRGLA